MEELRRSLSEALEARAEAAQWLSDNWKVMVATAAGMYLTSAWARANWKTSQSRRKIAARQRETADQRARLRQALTGNGSPELELVTGHRKSILEMDVEQLVEKLQAGQLQPTKVLEAYQAQALEVTEKKNCVCLFLEESSEWASALESLSAEERRARPLFGVPLSVKECFQVKGYDYTAGMSTFLGRPASDDAPLIRHLKDLGAVPFCMTNLPQTMKSFGCSNPIYGSTSHPKDDERSPGGSSGGEGCLMALGGSVLGIGTDVGGSLRTPATFCGVVGFKPTTSRVYVGGRRQGSRGQLVGVYSTAGFMSRTVAGVTLAMRSILSDPRRMALADHRVSPIPWQPDLFAPGRKLKIGWYDDLNVVEPTPGPRRVVREAAQMLREAGHEVVEFKFEDLRRADEFYWDKMLADEGANTLMWLDGDVIDQSISMNMVVWKMPRLLKWLVSSTIGKWISPTSAWSGGKGLYMSRNLWTSLEDLTDLIKEVLSEWTRLDLDVLIAPGFAFPAPFLADPARTLPAVLIPGTYNLFDFPAGVVPFGFGTKEDTVALEGYPTRIKGFDLMYCVIKAAARGSEGLPIGVQVIGRPYQEEMVLHAMKVVEELRKRQIGNAGVN